jgi:2-polyprenyl-3-methyl-5-hydroxy-6-metoxy-1,4-benzoquinol methylase
VIKEFADEFWARRAQETEGSIRWTNQQMLLHDQSLVEAVLPDGGELLDLGCGTGDLFQPFLDRLEHVTAVDMVPDFIARIPHHPRLEGVVSDLLAFTPTRSYDVAVLFGVVTYLMTDDERAVYEMLRGAVRPGGSVVVKNQCSRGEEIMVDGWSEAIAQRYVARYPSVAAQRELLETIFQTVTVKEYPEELNPWPDTYHVAYVCS